MLAETLGYILDERHEKGLQEGLQKGEARGIAKGLQEGEARGIAKGREEGALSILLRQIEIKFGTIEKADKDRLSQLDHDQIIRASARILTATTLEEIL